MQRPEEEQSLNVKLVELLAANTRALPFVVPITSLVLVAYLVNYADWSLLLAVGWFAAVLSICGLRWWLFQRFESDDVRASEQAERWLRRFTAFEVASGFVCGGICFLLPPMSTEQALIPLLVVAGQVTTSVTPLSASRSAFLAFALSSLGSCAVWLAMSGRPSALLMIGVLVSTFFLVYSTFRAVNRNLLRASKLQIEHQRLNQALRETQIDLQAEHERAERALLVKKQFLNHMSQELRTPMNGVMGALSVLNRRPQGREESMLSDIAYRTSRSMMTLLNEILDLSKEDQVAGKSHAVAFDPRMLLEEVIELLSCSAQVKDLRLLTLLPSSFPARLKGEPHRIRQILLNLVGNAIKFTPSGSVTLKADVVDDKLVIEVVDTGPGIGQSQIAHLMAERPDDGLDSGRGTGKGLMLCRELCRLLGGEMGVQSELGEGAQFWVQLPTEVLERAQPALRTDQTVVLVSDHPGVREMLASQLDLLGHRVSMLDSAEPLQTLLEQSRESSLVMLDMDLKQKISIQHYLRLQKVAAARGHHLVAMSAAGAHRLADSVHNLMLPCRLKVLQRVLAEHHQVDRAVTKDTPAQLAEAAVDAAARKVLVIDDSDINRLLLKRMLQELDWRVDLAESLDEASHFTGQQDYQLIIVDAAAAKSDAAVAELRQSNQASRLLVVADPTDAHRASLYRKQGADGLLSRPITLENLEDTLTGVTVGVAD